MSVKMSNSARFQSLYPIFFNFSAWFSKVSISVMNPKIEKFTSEIPKGSSKCTAFSLTGQDWCVQWIRVTISEFSSMEEFYFEFLELSVS